MFMILKILNYNNLPFMANNQLMKCKKIFHSNKKTP